MENPLVRLLRDRQLRILALALTVFLAAIAFLYLVFLRPDYVTLFNGLRSADAAAIVSQLDAKGVSYKLRDGGTTILVRKNEADAVRLSVVGSDALAKGESGFELFNKSDMGLTDFAQKINYQRALQGELARTIMMMDGIADARVHLALPERSLFRGNRSAAKAAVTISMRTGEEPDERRVAGIQRLIAASVPDLALGDVVVLDEYGRVISAPPANETETPPNDEQGAAQQYYRARARSAIQGVLPDVPFDVRVLLQSQAGEPQPWTAAPKDGPASSPGTTLSTPTRRPFALQILVVTPRSLDQDERNVIGNAVSQAVAFDSQAGDAMQFAVGPIAPPASAPAMRLEPLRAPAPPTPPSRDDGISLWSWPIKLAIALTVVLAAVLLRMRTGGLSVEARDAFLRRIRRHLGVANENDDARA